MPLALVPFSATRKPLLLVRVTLLVESTLPVYPTIQLERARFVELTLPAA